LKRSFDGYCLALANSYLPSNANIAMLMVVFIY